MDWPHIFIEAPESEAKVIFYNRFGRNPDKVTCACCGNDYSTSESESLEQATGYYRNLRWCEDVRGWHYGKKDQFPNYRDPFYLEPHEEIPEGMKVADRYRYRSGNGVTLAEYIANGGDGLSAGRPLVVHADEIKPEEASR